MRFHAFLRGALAGLYAVYGAVHATPECPRAPDMPPAGADASAGRQHLGQGISLYESRKLVQAERALQAALFAGLTDKGEQATAHKYLGFIYCTNQEWARCDVAFESALAARPSFTLEEYEVKGTPWRDAYLKARGRSRSDCPNTPPSAYAPGPGGMDTQTFALNSRVIISITPLLAPANFQSLRFSEATGAGRLAAQARAPRADNNVQLRVAPWAHVNVNGKRLGVTPPLTELKLPPGSHTVELMNPGFDTVRKTIQVEAGQTLTISHDFDAR